MLVFKGGIIMNITSTYEKHANENSLRPALITAKETLSYKEWNDLIQKTAGWFQNYSKKPLKVAFLLQNSLESLQIFAGASRAGWTAIPLDPRSSPMELEERLSLSSPHVLLTSSSLSRKLSFTKKFILVEDWKIEVEKTSPSPILSVDPHSPFYMGFTSGSTGKPKAFLRSQKSWVKSFDCNKTDFHMHSEECVLVPGPLVHSLFLYGAISTLFLGGTVHLLERFSPSTVLSLLKSKNITTVYSVPTMIEALLSKGEKVNSSFKMLSSGAKWEPSTRQKALALFPFMKHYEFYGASELSFVSVLNNENRNHASSVGTPCQHVSIKIVGDNGEMLPPCEIGTVYVKSELRFLGYLNGDGIDSPDEWITVDDMGYLDEQGFLYIIGRKHNMILYGGLNIFPEEIEEILKKHENVQEAAVIGITDTYWGQKPLAFIVGSASKRELSSFVREHLSSYKVPRLWRFVKELPYTSSGKIARQALKNHLETEEIQ